MKTNESFAKCMYCGSVTDRNPCNTCTNSSDMDVKIVTMLREIINLLKEVRMNNVQN